MYNITREGTLKIIMMEKIQHAEKYNTKNHTWKNITRKFHMDRVRIRFILTHKMNKAKIIEN